MYDDQPIADSPFTGTDPLGPVATMPAVTFGAREAALAGVGRGMTGADADRLPATMFTWHITCSSITFSPGAPQGRDQP
jgi:hypothetical protein